MTLNGEAFCLELENFKGLLALTGDSTEQCEAVITHDWATSRILVRIATSECLSFEPVRLRGALGAGLQPQDFSVWWNQLSAGSAVGISPSVVFVDNHPIEPEFRK